MKLPLFLGTKISVYFQFSKQILRKLLSSETGDFYGIVSSGYEGVERLKKRPLLWAGSAVITPATDSATEPVTTLDARQGGEQIGSASGQSGLSAGKDSDISSTVQGKLKKVLKINLRYKDLMHRFYGVANIDGVDYCVMTLMKKENCLTT